MSCGEGFTNTTRVLTKFPHLNVDTRERTAPRTSYLASFLDDAICLAQPEFESSHLCLPHQWFRIVRLDNDRVRNQELRESSAEAIVDSLKHLPKEAREQPHLMVNDKDGGTGTNLCTTMGTLDRDHLLCSFEIRRF